MVDAPGLGPDAERCGGSSPPLAPNLNLQHNTPLKAKEVKRIMSKINKNYGIFHKLPDFGIYGLIYLSGGSILYGTEFFSRGLHSISYDLIAYGIMVFSLLSF